MCALNSRAAYLTRGSLCPNSLSLPSILVPFYIQINAVCLLILCHMAGKSLGGNLVPNFGFSIKQISHRTYLCALGVFNCPLCAHRHLYNKTSSLMWMSEMNLNKKRESLSNSSGSNPSKCKFLFKSQVLMYIGSKGYLNKKRVKDLWFFVCSFFFPFLAVDSTRLISFRTWKQISSTAYPKP